MPFLMPLVHRYLLPFKVTTLLTFLALIGLSGCAGPEVRVDQNSKETLARSSPAKSVASTSVQPVRRSLQLSQELVIPPTITVRDTPNVVIVIEPVAARLTSDMELRLQHLLAETTKNERVLLRLESYVPAGGSPSLDLTRSEKALHVVRDRLLALGISARRLLASSFGAEHDHAYDPERPWVEIYLVKTGTDSTGASNTASPRR